MRLLVTEYQDTLCGIHQATVVAYQQNNSSHCPLLYYDRGLTTRRTNVHDEKCDNDNDDDAYYYHDPWSDENENDDYESD